MAQRAGAKRNDSLARLARFLFVGLAALGCTAGLTARGRAPEETQPIWPSKGLYYGGQAYGFRAEWYFTGPPELRLEALRQDGLNWSMTVTSVSVGGDIGACVFNGLLYCFFTTAGGDLQYVAVDPSTKQVTGPNTVAMGVGSSGAVAAVSGDVIYVLVAPSHGFQSSDGKSFTTWTPQFSQAQPAGMIAAATFYPMGDDPASILFVYNDGANPPNLRSCVIAPPAMGTATNEATLPWPPANPYAWQPILDGTLLLGTSGAPTPGALAPCVQFYGLTNLGTDNQHQGRWEYNLTDQTWTFYDVTKVQDTLYLIAYPWFSTPDSTGKMEMIHVMNTEAPGSSYDAYYPFDSDWMVPQNDDPTYGWAGTPTPTADAAGTELQNLWTLVGVVLGPAPFPMNGASDACADSGDVFSCVSYGKDTSSTVTTTTTSSATVSVASDSKIKGGIGELSFDLSYAHAWTAAHTSSQSVSVSEYYGFGPCSETAPDQGISGWAIFNAPTLVTQWYKLYAYDDSTYLNQDLYATATGAVVQQTAYFLLADPSQGQYAGLFAGMPVYPNSTDVADWYGKVPDWGMSNPTSWSVKIGPDSDPQIEPLDLGTSVTLSYTTSDTTIGSSGNSNSFSVQAGAKLSILGFSEGITVGYDGTWTTETENESTITEDVTCTYNVKEPAPNNPDYYSSVTVQPFWLQATTDKAPWLPTAYGGNLPWCITWAVTSYQTEGGGAAGVAAAPGSASGTIHHGGDNEKDTYALSGGRMAWLHEDGSQTPLPMTADQFEASAGASVSLNGHLFSADGSKGKWSRSGDTWTYKTRQGAKGDRFTLGLNFGSQTWSFDGASKSLDHEVRAADPSVQIGLSLQGRYAFSHWLGHDVHATWSHEEKKISWQPYGVHEVKGDYDQTAGAGHLSLKGHIPKKTSSFGDLEIRVNGVSVRVPLLSTPGFLQALQKGGKVKVQAAGLSFDIDFGTGEWKAAVDGAQFKAGMAPRGGATRVKLLLGGSPISDQTFVLQKCTTDLKFSG